MKTVVLCFISFALLCSASTGQTCTPIITNGLAAYYPFCGNPNDVSGNGSNGTLNGCQLTTDRFGNPNSAYLFNGTSDYIALPTGTSTTLDITGDFTLSFWIKTIQGSNHIIALGDNVYANSGGYLAGLNDGSAPYGKLGFATQGLWNNSTDTLNDNNWHNLTLVLKADTMRLYGDATMDTEVYNVPAPLSWNGTRAFGTRNDFVNGFYQGILDDVYIFSRALTSTEVGTLFDPLATGIIDNGTQNEVLIYPNPALGSFHISLPNAGQCTANIIAADGRILKSLYIQNGKAVDCSFLSAGIYYIVIRNSSGGIFSRKLAVMNK
jgi:hypothetical protein